MSRRGASIALLVTLLIACLVPRARAHEMRPSLVELRERADGVIALEWKVAFARDAPLPLELVLPARCERAPGIVEINAARTVRSETASLRCGDAGLEGVTIAVRGLEVSGTEVLARARFHDGPALSRVLRANSSRWTITAVDGESPTGSGSPGQLAYLRLGVEHILGGADHLVFVLGLVALVWGRWRALVGAVTSFTAAHSVTLAITALGLVRVVAAAVEAIIALSILLLAVELSAASEPRAAPSWTVRAPWIVAFVCGLVHGFGFAGALSEIGLPADAVWPALLMFNLGVELGQLAFVGALVLLGTLALRVSRGASARAARVAWTLVTYAIGGLATFWLIERARAALL